jgi:hypothetical protein
MGVVFSVNLVDLKQACRRLVVRLADEAERETKFVIFNAAGDTIEMLRRSLVTSRPLPPHSERRLFTNSEVNERYGDFINYERTKAKCPLYRSSA